MLSVLVLAVTLGATPAPKAPPRPLFRTPKAVRSLAPEVLEKARRAARTGKLSRTVIQTETDASPDQVWDAITTANPRIMWRNRSATYRAIQRDPEPTIFDRWDGLRVGDKLFIDIHALPHTPLADLGVGIEVRAIDVVKKRLVLGYTDVGPAEGTQVISLYPKRNTDGTTGTRVVHLSAFRGRSLIEHLAYRPVHNLVLRDLWKSIFHDAENIREGRTSASR